MKTKFYIVKNLTPWMMDELKSFSEMSSYKLILLRVPLDFYKDDLEYLKENNVEIFVQPFSSKNLPVKLRTALAFFFKNLHRFDFGYNSVIGIKSIYWFLKLNLGLFKGDCQIHAQFATQPALMALLVKRAFKNKPTIAFTFHAYDIYFKNRWFDLLVRESDKAFSISEYNIKYVEENFLHSDNLALSRLGVFRSTIKANGARRDSSVFVLGLMSWFVEKKGIIYLLKALQLLRQKGHADIRLRLAGDGPLFKELSQFVIDNELDEMVEFLGKIKGEEKADFYTGLDVFVLPSIQLKKDQDGIPVVLMEALAYGLPIISTDVSGIPEICVQNYNGELIPERNVDRIVESVLSLKKDKEKVMRYAENSKKLSDQYDIEINSRNKLKAMKWLST